MAWEDPWPIGRSETFIEPHQGLQNAEDFSEPSQRSPLLPATFANGCNLHCVLPLGYMLEKVPALCKNLVKGRDLSGTFLKITCPSLCSISYLNEDNTY